MPGSRLWGIIQRMSGGMSRSVHGMPCSPHLYIPNPGLRTVIYPSTLSRVINRNQVRDEVPAIS